MTSLFAGKMPSRSRGGAKPKAYPPDCGSPKPPDKENPKEKKKKNVGRGKGKEKFYNN